MDATTIRTDPLTDTPGDGQKALDAVVSRVYQELRAIAHRRLMAGGGNGTLSTTALVHEAYLKLVDQTYAEWTDHGHFLAVASLAMRHVLVDRARERQTLKRGGERRERCVRTRCALGPVRDEQLTECERRDENRDRHRNA